MFGSSDVRHPARVAEVLGPPGAGKSTLLAALTRLSPQVAPIDRYRSLRTVSAYALAGARLLPVLTHAARRTGGAPKQLNWIIRLEASPGVLRRRLDHRARVVLFDQGPAYTLVRLHEQLTGSPPQVRSWWNRSADRWRRTLNLLIVVDAPDEVLLHRIRSRDKTHSFESLGQRRALASIAAYRRTCEAVTRTLAGEGGPVVLRLDSAATSLEQQLSAVASALHVTLEPELR